MMVLACLGSIMSSGCSLDSGANVFTVLLVNDLTESATVYGCNTSDCKPGELADPQTVRPGGLAQVGASSDGGTNRYLIVGLASRRRSCFTLSFNTKLNNVRVPMSDATSF
jgi:hypothetical protein